MNICAKHHWLWNDFKKTPQHCDYTHLNICKNNRGKRRVAKSPCHCAMKDVKKTCLCPWSFKFGKSMKLQKVDAVREQKANSWYLANHSYIHKNLNVSVVRTYKIAIHPQTNKQIVKFIASTHRTGQNSQRNYKNITKEQQELPKKINQR